MGNICCIAAVSRDGIIGVDGKLPWHSAQELAYFKKMTQGKNVVMGRTTWESLPKAVRPLPGRHNIVLSRDPDYFADGAETMHSLDDAVAFALHSPRHTYVIGGAQIYEAFAPYYEFVSLTAVNVEIGYGTWLPDVMKYGRWTSAPRPDLSFYEDGVKFAIAHSWRVSDCECCTPHEV